MSKESFMTFATFAPFGMPKSADVHMPFAVCSRASGAKEHIQRNISAVCSAFKTDKN
jgi:hypothetical protein